MGLFYGPRRTLLGGIKIPTFNFDTAKASFTAKMAKRTAPGPFDAAPIVQGDWDTSNLLDGDYLTYPRGGQISGNFYAGFDTYQGTVVFWITPEWDGDNGKRHNILSAAPGGLDFVIYKDTNDNLYVHVNASSFYVDVSGWAAGTTYCVVCRWDVDNDLDGTNYQCISIDDTHTFGKSSAIGDPGVPDNAIPVGNERISDGADYPANAIMEGLTVYRRLLYDGTYGTDLGNGDEINLISAGAKPEEVTGGEDILFSFPTDGTAEELVTGTGEAHSFPSASNELANWHMQDDDDTAGAPDDWTNVNAATLADAAAADILYGVRSQKITVDAADEGIRGDTTPTAGDDKAVFAILKTGGAAQGVDLRIYDNDNAANIVEMTTDASAWTLFNTCYQVPAGCTDVQHFIESTDADSYDIHVAQVQVLPSLWIDGGMETGTAWTNVGTPTSAAQDAGQAHSAANSWKVVADAADEGGKRAITTTSGKFYLVTGWVYADTAGTVDLTVGSQTVTSSGNDAWKKLTLIFQASAASTDVSWLSNAAQTFYIDDVSVIELSDVSITATAASEANSAEGDGVRVDGLDTMTQAPALSGSKWRINWTGEPRHAPADMISFGNSEVYLFEWYVDADNYIRIFADTANQLDMTFNADGGGEQSGNADVTALWTADEELEFSLQAKGTKLIFSIDGVAKITISAAAVFANAPDENIYFGSDRNGAKQFDMVLS